MRFRRSWQCSPSILRASLTRSDSFRPSLAASIPLFNTPSAITSTQNARPRAYFVALPRWPTLPPHLHAGQTHSLRASALAIFLVRQHRLHTFLGAASHARKQNDHPWLRSQRCESQLFKGFRLTYAGFRDAQSQQYDSMKRPFLKVFLVALLSYQYMYFGWEKLRQDEIMEERLGGLILC